MYRKSLICKKTRVYILAVVLGTYGLLTGSRVMAEDKNAKSLENTIETCRDGLDNDRDLHIDCDDQDCEVYSICYTVLPHHALTEKEDPVVEMDSGPIEKGNLCSDNIDNDGNGKIDCDDKGCSVAPWCPAGGEAGPLCRDGKDNDNDGLRDCEEPACKISRHCQAGREMGLQCQDGKDNNSNGLVDCHEPSCQDSKFCAEEIVYIPEPSDKPIGLLMSLGIGFAFPNWAPPEGNTEITQGNRYVIPYKPDVGPLADLSLEYMFTTWVGFGVKSMIAGTGVQSRNAWSEEDYKFDGVKVYFNASGFVRFQYPFDRIVPFMNFAMGYSYVQYRWVTFSRFEESDETRRTMDLIMEPPSHHMTIAGEVGVDVYVIKRYLAFGIKTWLPIAATSDSGMDNTAAMLTATYTPFWPEKPAIRPKYLDPEKTSSSSAPK
ncbi:MAG: hypothetical protein GY847_36315 [Proteobacteria bacterium]|nr:hypothetical protein [Pseudomonadota bacterium]